MNDSKKQPAKPDNSAPDNAHPDPADDNRANQLNPNNDAYWQSRGQPKPK